MSTQYESIVLLHGEEAAEALAILDARGAAETIEHLKQWHEPGEGTLVSTKDGPWRPTDEREELDRFVMYFDRAAPYIGLVCKLEI